MKKIVFLACIAFAVNVANAQIGSILDKAKGVATATGFDVNKLSSGIMGKLTPELNLTNTQIPKVSNAITNFLGEKAKILPLQASNPASYKTKFGGLFSNLKTKLTGILVQQQMSKLMGLKPAKLDPANVVSQLFF